MKFGKACIVSVFTVVLVLPVKCMADNFVKNMKPYVGANIGLLHTPFKHGYGNNIYAKDSPEVGINFGGRFTDYFGFEIGYEKSKKKYSTSRIGGGDNPPGAMAVFLGDTHQFRTYYRLKGPYGSVSLCTKISNKNKISAAFGISLYRLKAGQEWYQVGNFSQSFVDDSKRTFKKTKFIPILKVGNEYIFSDHFAIDLHFTWKATSKFSVKSEENISGPTEIKLKNSYNFGLGFRYYIC